MPTFIEQCVKGKAKIDDIDDYVDAWHDGTWEGQYQTLSQYLGMSGAEYCAWVANPELLPSILETYCSRARVEY